MQRENYKISVNVSDACRYMGVTGVPDAQTLAEAQRMAGLVEESARPRVVTKLLRLEGLSPAVTLQGSALRLEGRSISALLHDCESCVLFCATIGDEIEALLRRYQLKTMASAAVLDACASSAVESLCNEVQARLSSQLLSEGFFLTDRFSPGYGDLPIAIQRDFCAELDTARKIGVFVSADGIMIPRKSVTAMLGVSKKPQKSRDTGCDGCEMAKHCNFRESGVTCYGQAL